MKRILAIAAVSLGVLLGFVGIVSMRMRADKPEYLVGRLRHAEGKERQDLLLRLSLARGDVLTVLIEAFEDTDAEPSFRADMLDLIFKGNLRGMRDDIGSVFQKALEDPVPDVRRKAAYGIVAYADRRHQVALAGCVTDSDPQVRKQAYSVFAAGSGGRRSGSNIYRDLADEDRKRLVDNCLTQMKKETDPELAFLARAVVGREIDTRCSDAIQALASADLVKAKELIEGALELDPKNHQARVRLVRYYLETGDKEKALSSAREYGALIEVPCLSKAPEIDGDPSEAVWSEGYTTDTFYHTTSRWVAKRTSGKSRLHFGHRNGRLYIAVLGFEEDLDKLVVKHKSRDSSIWLDDCVEFVFDPGNTGKEYIQFVINPAGALFDTKNRDRRQNYDCECKARVFPKRGYWAVEFAVDSKELHEKPITSESIWSLNFFRVRIGPASEHGSIWPAYGRTHKMELYPIAIFKDGPTASSH